MKKLIFTALAVSSLISMGASAASRTSCSLINGDGEACMSAIHSVRSKVENACGDQQVIRTGASGCYKNWLGLNCVNMYFYCKGDKSTSYNSDFADPSSAVSASYDQAPYDEAE